MAGLDEYARSTVDAMKEGAGDMTRHAFADIGDSYQEVLMSSASISPPDGLTGSMEQVTMDTTPAPDTAAPELDAERG